MKTLTRGALFFVACGLMVASPVFGLEEAQTYQYDFTDGSAGWELDDNWALGSWASGGQALMGDDNGIAHHAEGSGVLREVSLRFEMDPIVAYYCLRFGGGGEPAGLEYAICFEDLAVSVTSRLDGTIEDLAFVPFSVEGGLPHTVRVLTGGESLDVFIDDVGVVGVDAADPATGSVRINAGPKRVIVDDVVVVLGGNGAGHDRAPRPAEDLPLGPDIGPFVDGKVVGDLALSGTDLLELSGGRYVVADGNITITDNATLAIAGDAVLAFEIETSPLLHFGVHLSGNGRFEVNGGRVIGQGIGPLIVVAAAGTSSVEMHDCAPWIHMIQVEGDSSLILNDVRLVTSGGGQIALADRAQVDVSNSELASIGFDVPEYAVFRAEDLGWDELVDDFDFRRDFETEGIDYDLRLLDVVLYPSSMTDGANEKGWIVGIDSTATLVLTDSEIGKLNLVIAAGADGFEATGLRIAEPADFSYKDIILDDVTVNQQWGFFIFGTRLAVFEDCEGLWLFPYDEVDVVLKQSVMSEFDPRDYTGTVTFEDGEWESAACEIIDNNDFTVRGKVETTAHLRGCSWSDSVMHRVYDVALFDGSGSPVASTVLTATRGSETKTATTDENGAAVFTFTFDDEDRFLPWTITGPGDAEATVDAFESSPVLMWTSQPPVRIRPGAIGRVTP